MLTVIKSITPRFMVEHKYFIIYTCYRFLIELSRKVILFSLNTNYVHAVFHNLKLCQLLLNVSTES